jgi:hypothetical protein
VPGIGPPSVLALLMPSSYLHACRLATCKAHPVERRIFGIENEVHVCCRRSAGV